jgi:hypothetical protein
VIINKYAVYLRIVSKEIVTVNKITLKGMLPNTMCHSEGVHTFQRNTCQRLETTTSVKMWRCFRILFLRVPMTLSQHTVNQSDIANGVVSVIPRLAILFPIAAGASQPAVSQVHTIFKCILNQNGTLGCKCLLSCTFLFSRISVCAPRRFGP